VAHAARALRRLNMPMVRFLVGEEPLFEGDVPVVPNAGDLVTLRDHSHRVESVTWDVRDATLGPVMLRVGELPYGY
jgi:hypothetical protein